MSMTFTGYQRPNGAAGIRNRLLLLAVRALSGRLRAPLRRLWS